MSTLAERSCWRSRIGRGRDFSWSWSALTRLLAYDLLNGSYLGPADGPLKEPAGCLASRRVWRRESGAMDCLLPGGGARACVYLPRKSRRTTWGSWSGGLVGELGADVHRVIIDREAPEQGVADQDLVQHLRVALEHRGVALGLDQAHWALSTRRPADPQFIVTAPNVLLQCLPRRTTLAQRSLEPAHRTWLELGKA